MEPARIISSHESKFSWASDPTAARAMDRRAVWAFILACAAVGSVLCASAFAPFGPLSALLALISLIAGGRAICECRNDGRMRGYRYAIVGVIVGYSIWVMWTFLVVLAVFGPWLASISLAVGAVFGTFILAAIAPNLAGRLILVACVLALPAALLPVYAFESRESARMQQCRDNLRTLALDHLAGDRLMPNRPVPEDREEAGSGSASD